MLVNRLLFLSLLLSMPYSLAKEAKNSLAKVSATQAILAELEDCSLKMGHHEAELALLSERLDDLEDKLTNSLAEKHKLPSLKQVELLETEQKKIQTSLKNLASSLKETQSHLQVKLKSITESHEALLKDLKLLRRSLASLIDGSIPGEYPEIICEPAKNIYIVQKGDSLWTIAHKYQISPSEIKKLNKLSSDAIYAGQRLMLPPKTK